MAFGLDSQATRPAPAIRWAGIGRGGGGGGGGGGSVAFPSSVPFFRPLALSPRQSSVLGGGWRGGLNLPRCKVDKIQCSQCQERAESSDFH